MQASYVGGTFSVNILSKLVLFIKHVELYLLRQWLRRCSTFSNLS